MKLEDFGKIFATGFGDRVLVGVIVGFLDDTTPDRCYEYIQKNMQALHWASEDEWVQLRELVKNADIKDISVDDVVNELREYRLDILGVIINHPDGMKWLQSQVDIMRKKLELA